MSKRLKPQYAGGFVRTPVAGIHKKIIVLDFRSLYPSIIIAHNISPETMNCSCKACRKDFVPGFEDRWFCKNKEGSVPKRLKKILADRDNIKKKLKLHPHDQKLIKKEHGLKLAANITYGYFGYPNSPYYNVKAAESISAFGRHYIQKVIFDAEDFGFKIIYADTDSVFLTGNARKIKPFLKKINSKFKLPIKMEYRGIYEKGLFVSKKGGEAAKKKYALIDKKGNLLIRGFEARREDWCELAKGTQVEVLKHILEGKKNDAIKYVRRIISKLRKGKIKKSELIISEQITKPLSKYKITAPNVVAATKLEKQGKKISPGTFVKYFISSGTGSVSERSTPENSNKKIDYEYYVTNQVVPAALRVLTDFGVTEDDLIG